MCSKHGAAFFDSVSGSRILKNSRGGVVGRVAIATLSLALFAPSLQAQDAAAFFKKNCVTCHTIGAGRLVGPDLKNVTKHKERAWLENFIQNPQAVIDSGDQYARKLVSESNGVIMPTLPGVTPEMAKSLLDLIEAESKLPKSHFTGLKFDDKPFTQEDVELGRKIFLGRVSLKNGGPACNSCHTLRGLGGFGGGRLGPDKTTVFNRLGGRKAMQAWLGGPATTTMKAVFDKHPLEAEEIRPLVAFFKEVASDGKPNSSSGRFYFFFVALIGSALCLVAFDRIWRNRFRAVRRPMISKSDARNKA